MSFGAARRCARLPEEAVRGSGAAGPCRGGVARQEAAGRAAERNAALDRAQPYRLADRSVQPAVTSTRSWIRRHSDSLRHGYPLSWCCSMSTTSSGQRHIRSLGRGPGAANSRAASTCECVPGTWRPLGRRGVPAHPAAHRSRGVQVAETDPLGDGGGARSRRTGRASPSRSAGAAPKGRMTTPRTSSAGPTGVSTRPRTAGGTASWPSPPTPSCSAHRNTDPRPDACTTVRHCRPLLVDLGHTPFLASARGPDTQL